MVVQRKLAKVVSGKALTQTQFLTTALLSTKKERSTKGLRTTGEKPLNQTGTGGKVLPGGREVARGLTDEKSVRSCREV